MVETLKRSHVDSKQKHHRVLGHLHDKLQYNQDFLHLQLLGFPLLSTSWMCEGSLDHYLPRCPGSKVSSQLEVLKQETMLAVLIMIGILT